MPTDRPHRGAKVQSFRDDPDYAATYLTTVLQDGDDAELRETFDQLTEAFGDLPQFVAEAQLEPATLYRLLAGNAKLKLRNLPDIPHALGLAEQ
jgi:DNA-binding phage protein